MRTHHNYHLTLYDVRTHKPGITSRETRNHRSFSHIHVEKVAARSKCLHNVYGAKILSGHNSGKLLLYVRVRRMTIILSWKNARAACTYALQNVSKLNSSFLNYFRNYASLKRSLCKVHTQICAQVNLFTEQNGPG